MKTNAYTLTYLYCGVLTKRLPTIQNRDKKLNAFAGLEGSIRTREESNLNKVFDKSKPIFEAIAANKYVSDIRDGFIACMPNYFFSSIYLMIAYVLYAWGFYWQ